MDSIDNEVIDIQTISKEKSNIILFSAGQIVSLLGTYIYSFAISLYILKVTGSGTSFAFSILLSILPRAIIGPVAGSLSDRVNRKKMTILMDVLSGAVVLLVLVLSMLYGLLLPFIYITTFILAVLSTLFNTCFDAAIPRLVTDRKLVKINSYNRAIDSGCQVLGPVMAGYIFSFVPMNLFMLINGLSFLISAVSKVFIDFNLNRPQQENKPAGTLSLKTILHDFKEVFSFIRHNKLLSLIMPFSMICNLWIAAAINVMLPFLINKVLGMSSRQYGIIEGSFSLGMLAAAIVIGKLPEKEKKRKGLAAGISGMGLALILMGIPGIGNWGSLYVYFSFVLYIILAVLFAMFLLMVDLPLAVVVQRSIPDHMLGRVMGVTGTISTSLMPIGVILAGIILDIIPAYLIFFAAGIYFISAALIMYKSKAMQDY